MRRRRAAPPARSGRGLVRRQRPDRHAAAGERRRRPHRLQDRHLLRLSRRLVGRLRRQAHHRRLGRAAGRRAGAGLVGRVVAAPILFDAFARTGEKPAPLPHAPRGALFSASGKLPPPLRNFRPNGTVAGDSTAPPLRIVFPPNNSRVELTTYDGKPDPLALKITGGVEPLTVLVNGVPAAARADRRTLFVEPDGPGFLRLTVIDAKARPTASWSACSKFAAAMPGGSRSRPFPSSDRRCNVPDPTSGDSSSC